MLTRGRDFVALSSTRQWRYLELPSLDALLGFMHAVLILKPDHRFFFLDDQNLGREVADLLDLSCRDIDGVNPEALGIHPIYVGTFRVYADWVNQHVKYVIIDSRRNDDYKKLVLQTYWRCIVIGVQV
jgi:hypothetical protein